MPVNSPTPSPSGTPSAAQHQGMGLGSMTGGGMPSSRGMGFNSMTRLPSLLSGRGMAAQNPVKPPVSPPVKADMAGMQQAQQSLQRSSPAGVNSLPAPTPQDVPTPGFSPVPPVLSTPLPTCLGPATKSAALLGFQAAGLKSKRAADKQQVEKLVQDLWEARQTLHEIHLRTRSYSAHKALNEGYDELLDEIDNFIETYQGQYGLLKQPTTLTIQANADPAEYLDRLTGLIRTARAAMGPNDTHLQNMLDEMLSTSYHVIYFLTFLNKNAADYGKVWGQLATNPQKFQGVMRAIRQKQQEQTAVRSLHGIKEDTMAIDKTAALSTLEMPPVPGMPKPPAGLQQPKPTSTSLPMPSIPGMPKPGIATGGAATSKFNKPAGLQQPSLPSAGGLQSPAPSAPPQPSPTLPATSAAQLGQQAGQQAGPPSPSPTLPPGPGLPAPKPVDPLADQRRILANITGSVNRLSNLKPGAATQAFNSKLQPLQAESQSIATGWQNDATKPTFRPGTGQVGVGPQPANLPAAKPQSLASYQNNSHVPTGTALDPKPTNGVVGRDSTGNTVTMPTGPKPGWMQSPDEKADANVAAAREALGPDAYRPSTVDSLGRPINRPMRSTYDMANQGMHATGSSSPVPDADRAARFQAHMQRTRPNRVMGKLGEDLTPELLGKMAAGGAWIACDLDNTLATDNQDPAHFDPHVIGPPIAKNVAKVKKALADGKTVKIFTARVAKTGRSTRQAVVQAVQKWCKQHIGQELEVTNAKDPLCTEIWDDRAVKMAANQQFPARLLGKFMPLQGRRTQLEPDEQAEWDESNRHWIEPIIQTEATPLTSLGSSPWKQGIIAGVPAAVAGGLAGHYAGGAVGHPNIGTAIGAALAGLTMGGRAALQDHRKDSRMEEIIRRLPPHATLRDARIEGMLENSMMSRFGGEKSSVDLTPFARAFIENLQQQGYSLSGIKQAADRYADLMGPEAYQELSSGLEKLANPYLGGSAGGQVPSFAGSVAGTTPHIMSGASGLGMTADHAPSLAMPSGGDYTRALQHTFTPWQVANTSYEDGLDKALKWGARGAAGTAAVAGGTAAALTAPAWAPAAAHGLARAGLAAGKTALADRATGAVAGGLSGSYAAPEGHGWTGAGTGALAGGLFGQAGAAPFERAALGRFGGSLVDATGATQHGGDVGAGLGFVGGLPGAAALGPVAAVARPLEQAAAGFQYGSMRPVTKPIGMAMDAALKVGQKVPGLRNVLPAANPGGLLRAATSGGGAGLAGKAGRAAGYGLAGVPLALRTASTLAGQADNRLSAPAAAGQAAATAASQQDDPTDPTFHRQAAPAQPAAASAQQTGQTIQTTAPTSQATPQGPQGGIPDGLVGASGEGQVSVVSGEGQTPVVPQASGTAAAPPTQSVMGRLGHGLLHPGEVIDNAAAAIKGKAVAATAGAADQVVQQVLAKNGLKPDDLPKIHQLLNDPAHSTMLNDMITKATDGQCNNLDEVKATIGPAIKLAKQAGNFDPMSLLDKFTSWMNPLFEGLGMGGQVSPIMKLILLFGGGSLLGGMLTGSSGLQAIGGLGLAAGLASQFGMFGGQPGQAAPQPNAAAAATQQARDAANRQAAAAPQAWAAGASR